MTLTVIAAFRSKLGHEDRLRTALEAMIEPSLDEPGCLAFQPNMDPNQAGRLVVIEEWTSRRAQAEHLSTDYAEHLRQVLELVLAEPPRTRTFVAAPDG
jgi:quinol monooxygenase YgiN